MKQVRRLIAWSVILGLLTAAGVGVFHFVRYRPRCTIAALHPVHHVSSDGRWLVTCEPAFVTMGKDLENWMRKDLGHWHRAQEERAPVLLQVWDASNGQVVRSFETYLPVSQSPDARLFACVGRDGKLEVLDWQSGETWSVDLKPSKSGACC
jgi:hypothetical protein